MTTKRQRDQIYRDIEPLCALLDVMVYPVNDGRLVMFRKGNYLDTHTIIDPQSLEEAKSLLHKHFICPKNPSRR